MNALLALLIIAYVVLAAFFKFPSRVAPIPPKETKREQRQHPKFPRQTGGDGRLHRSVKYVHLDADAVHVGSVLGKRAPAFSLILMPNFALRPSQPAAKLVQKIADLRRFPGVTQQGQP